uniref:F-box domain-containing protein n=1 Tax=Glossina palpalis gambiensis TaxID=67801 RepID=A0A1B0AYU3_9MUSC
MSKSNEKCGHVGEPIDSEMFHNSGCDTTLKKLDEATQTGIAETNDVMDSLSDIRDENSISLPALPNEIWLRIFSNLSHGDLLQVKLVCKYWFELAQAPQLQRKSKLVITTQNLKNICDFIKHQDFKRESVVIDEEGRGFSSEDREILLTVFKHLGSDVVRLKIYELSSLSMLSSLLPNLEELNLLDIYSQKSVSVNFNQFPNLKSLLMDGDGDGKTQMQLFSSFYQMSGIRLEALTLNIGRFAASCLAALASHASSLRWLNLKIDFDISRDVILQPQLEETLKNFTQLEVLHIKCHSGATARAILENLPKGNRLKTIALDFPYRDDNDVLEIVAQKWSHSLQRLELAHYTVTENSAKWLNSLSGKLNRLYLCECEYVPECLVNSIAPKTNKRLTELKLVNSNLTPKLFCDLFQRLPNLTTLDFSCNQITDLEMNYLFRHLVHLRHLFLDACKSENVIKQCCSTSNISNLKNLQTLQSCLCPIKVLEISKLDFKFKELTKLYLSPCSRSKNPPATTLVDISKYFPVLEEFCFYNVIIRHTSILSKPLCFPRLCRLNGQRLY